MDFVHEEGDTQQESQQNTQQGPEMGDPIVYLVVLGLGWSLGRVLAVVGSDVPLLRWSGNGGGERSGESLPSPPPPLAFDGRLRQSLAAHHGPTHQRNQKVRRYRANGSISLRFMEQEHAFNDLGNLLLLSAGKMRSGLEDFAELPARSFGFRWFWFAQKNFDGHAQAFRNRDKKLCAGEFAAVLPIVDVGVDDADPLGELSLRKSSSLAELFESFAVIRFNLHMRRISPTLDKNLHPHSMLCIFAQ